MQTNSKLMDYVLEDVKKYEGISRPLKASLRERLMVTEIAPGKLHPNPQDEFSMPEVGPHMGIVGKYEAEIRELQQTGEKIFEEPIVIEKMSPDGYMLLNGHHRWAAALRQGVKKIRVEIVNATTKADIKQMLARKTSDKRASIDLDDIILAGEGEEKEPVRFPYSVLFDRRMRLGMGAFLLELQRRGYDLWIFTATYQSQESINKFFKAHGIKVTGMINGMSRKKASQVQREKSLTAEFRNHYSVSITLLKDAIVYTDSRTKNYEIFELDSEKITAAKPVLDKLDQIDQLYRSAENEGTINV